MGSKRAIAGFIAGQFPLCRGGTLYDLFSGGGAVTHYAMAHGLFARFVINDANPMMPYAFMKACYGGFSGERRWISHDDFNRLRDTDPYVAICFSFGNNASRGYAYSRAIEPWKRAAHLAVIEGDFTALDGLAPGTGKALGAALSGIGGKRERRLALKAAIMDVAPPHQEECRQQHLERLERLANLQDIASMECLERLERRSGDYADVPIAGNGVIYCDPPYRDTQTYGGDAFDYGRFYDWCERQSLPVFISEYGMPDDRFTPVAEISKRVVMCATNNSARRIERLWRPNTQLRREAA